LGPKDKYPLPLSSPLLSALQRSSLVACAHCSVPGAYTCADCGAAYCAVACFKLHNEGQCHEAFCKRQVEQRLAGKTAGVKQRKAMAKVLEQQRKTREDDEGLDTETAERILKSRER
jgi:hypothetical protein